MTRWLRIYDDMIHDAKIIALSDALFRAWITLLCVTSKHKGVLPPPSEIVLILRERPSRVAKWLANLIEAGLLDRLEDGSLQPHNWDKFQYVSDVSDPTNAERQRRHRDRYRNVTVTGVTNSSNGVTVKRPDTESDTESDTDNREDVAASPPPKISRKKAKTSIPPDFAIAEKNAAYAKTLGFSDFETRREHQKFCMNAKANGRAYSDWHAAEHNWITKAAEFAGKRPRGEWDIPDDGMIEVLDQLALEAWDAYRIGTEGKPYPRNKKGGWRLPSKWPPGHGEKIMVDVEKLKEQLKGESQA